MFKIFLTIVLLIFVAVFSWPGETLAFFSSGKTVAANIASTGCWVAPTAPGLNSPADNSVTNTASVTFTWTAGSSSCPVATLTYRLQVHNIDTGVTTESDWIAGTSYTINSIAEGQHTWNVTVQDQDGDTTESGVYNLTIDKTIPSAPTLSVTDSWEKKITEKIINGNFTSGLTGWTTAGDVAIVNGVAKIGSDSSDPDYEGNYVWENRLMQSFDAGAKTLGISYDYHTTDTRSYDDPGFLIRLNGQEIFSKAAASVTDGSTGWQQFLYDLSAYSPADGKLNLAIYAGNTGDKTEQSWAFVKDVTTYLVTAPDHATYSFNSSDPNVNHYEYNTGSGWTTWNTGNNLRFPDGITDLIFRSVDNAGNVSSSAPVVPILTDTATPSAVLDLEVFSTWSNSAILDWTSPSEATKYDARFAPFPIFDEAGFATASAVFGVPAPKGSGLESLEVLGLNSNTNYWFAVKVADASPNWSSLVATSGATLVGKTINNGDLVINEVLWGGTASDWFVELRNMTDRSIPLANTKLVLNGTELASGFSAATVTPHGYFVITLSNSSDLAFSGGIFEMELRNSGDLIDKIGDGIKVFAGDDSHSMERTAVPGDGTNPLSWYTCLEGNTKGAENRSVNEPVPTPSSVPVPEPSPKPSASPSATAIELAPEISLIATSTAELPPTPPPEPTPPPTPVEVITPTPAPVPEPETPPIPEAMSPVEVPPTPETVQPADNETQQSANGEVVQ